VADVRLPRTLAPLFPGLPKQLDVHAATVSDVVDELEGHWPGIRDRLCEPGSGRIRTHVHFYVDRERAELETRLEPRSRVDVITAISGG
jgi:molybdopterin synthase sulfur carrier subunit